VLLLLLAPLPKLNVAEEVTVNLELLASASLVTGLALVGSGVVGVAVVAVDVVEVGVRGWELLSDGICVTTGIMTVGEAMEGMVAF